VATKTGGNGKTGLYAGVLGVIVIAAGAYWYFSREAPTSAKPAPVVNNQDSYDQPQAQNKPKVRTAPKTVKREKIQAPKAKPKELDKPRATPTRRKGKEVEKIDTSPRA